jgi:hypothetical protein
MSPKVLVFVAVLLLVAGSATGFMPVTSHGEACGSAFATGSTLGQAFAGVADSCSDLRSILRIPAITLLVAGGITLLAAGWINTARKEAAARRSS